MHIVYTDKAQKTLLLILIKLKQKEGTFTN